MQRKRPKGRGIGERMKLEIGQEERFFDFISNLNDKDKIALISHTDLDGIGAAKVINSVVGADTVKFLQYNEIDEVLAEQLKIDGYNKIIFSDLYVERGEVLKILESFMEGILILDHHPAIKDWNSKKTVFIKAEEGYCATYLCYELFGKTKDIEKLDWLVACSCIADFCNVKNADWMKTVFAKYEDETKFSERIGFVYEDVKKSKIYKLQWDIALATIYFKDNLKKVFDAIGDSFGDIGDIGEHVANIQGEIDSYLLKFEEQKKEFSEGYVFVSTPKFSLGSIISNLISSGYPDKVILIISEKEEGYSVSARCQNARIDMGIFVRKLISGLEGASGGGHRPAAGAYFLKKDFNEVMNRLGVKEI